MEQNKEYTTEDVVLEDKQLICALTKKIKTVSEKELTLQSMIMMLNEEYNFDLNDMERDFPFSYEDDEGKTKRAKADLVIFDPERSHDAGNMIRIAIVFDSKVKDKDLKKGVAATLGNYLERTDCEFGVWTNGNDLHYLQSEKDDFGQFQTSDISDFPGKGQSMQDLELSGERAHPRKPTNDSLVKTFKRCHDYIYGNEGMKKTAFWELLNLIFCKIYDEKRRFMDAEKGISYRRWFWVGVKEKNTEDGQNKVAIRIKRLFDELKNDDLFKEVFDGSNDKINLSPRGLAYVASELAKYSFLDATIDVKGTAYETIVSNTLKQEAGQFFTPRNVIQCMVEMMDPDQDTRVLDPACGSGGFLVMVLDHVRKKYARNVYSHLSGIRLEEKYNSPEVVSFVKGYAERMLFGFDFDPDLKKAARMNMVMAGDGHANIFNINSLDYPEGQLVDRDKVAPKVAESIDISQDRDFNFEFPRENAFGKFDMIFTNPPFGAKVEVDRSISSRYELGHNPVKDAYGNHVFNGAVKSSEAPEVLFIEQCYNFLKPGGKMAIVLPDGILGNPNTESVRSWILERFKLLASVDLPVETFLPQVGVQASLLFLQKKTAEEKLIDENYDVFMAIVEAVGKDRRGVPVYVRDEDGAELSFNHKKEWLTIDENGNQVVKSRNERVKRLDDDLPKVSEAYKEFLKGLQK